MKNRIKQLRNELNMNQTDFGNRIGVKQGSVAAYENGSRVPLDAVINSICREFNVNEEWIRYGTGNMYIEKTRSDTIAEFAGKLMKDEEESFRRRLIEALAELDEREWEVLEQIAIKATKKD